MTIYNIYVTYKLQTNTKNKYVLNEQLTILKINLCLNKVFNSQSSLFSIETCKILLKVV